MAQEASELIVAQTGCLVKLDQATELLSKGRFAAVVVEVDLSHSFGFGTDVDIEGEEILNFW